jgi:hypothetical protein
MFFSKEGAQKGLPIDFSPNAIMALQTQSAFMGTLTQYKTSVIFTA